MSLPSESNLLSNKPIRLEGFTLRADSATPVGRPTREHVEHALRFASSMQQASGYWIGDILAYVESRSDLKNMLDEIMSATGLARQTLHNKLYVARHVDVETRQVAPSESHAAAVAALAPPDQKRVLKRASVEGLTVRETKQVAKAMTRTKVIDGRAVLEGQFRVIYADPPWAYRQNNPTRDGSLRKADEHYPVMSVAELCKLPVAAHAMPDAVLFLWVPAPLLDVAFPVIAAWGFTYKSNRVWDKVLGNPGNYGMQVKHEHLLIAVRGSCLPDEPVPHDDSVEVIRRSNVHSEKPEEFRHYITKHWTEGPYLELFGRKKVKGWTVFGNDARLWKGGV